MENNQSKINEAVIAVTYRCNSRCQMCNIWQKTDHQELSPTAYQNLPSSLKEINISGGELFLRPDLIEVVLAITKTCPQAHLTFSTNGFATDLIINKLKEILKITNNISVAVSLDGLKEVHEKIRGVADGFEKVLATVNGLKELGIINQRLKLAFTLSDDNIDQLIKVYQLAKDLRVDFTLAAVHNSENYFSTADNKLTKKEEIKFALENLLNAQLKDKSFKQWLRAYFTYGLWQYITNHVRILPDYSGRSSIFIDPQGRIFSSDISNRKMGELNQAGFNITHDKIDRPIGWMICTVRPAIKKNVFKVGWWILTNKFTSHVSL